MNLLQLQHYSIKDARKSLFDYLELMTFNDLNKPVETFNSNTIAGLHTHVANIYLLWVAKICLQKELVFFDEKLPKTVGDLRAHFDTADTYLADFITLFSDQPGTGFPHPDRPGRTYAAWEVFTHVITHEFHHKGQLASMGRLLGYPPPDTDLIRF